MVARVKTKIIINVASHESRIAILEDGKLIEIQCTAETGAFSREDLTAMLDLAQKGSDELFRLQRQALGLD